MNKQIRFFYILITGLLLLGAVYIVNASRVAASPTVSVATGIELEQAGEECGKASVGDIKAWKAGFGLAQVSAVSRSREDQHRRCVG